MADTGSNRATWWEWAVPLAVYTAAVIPLAWAARERINPDAVSYLRNAMYIAQGRFADSISGYWSPLLSWCIAPLLLAGLDGLTAARVVLALWGAGLVLAGMLFVRRWGRRFEIRPMTRAGAGVLLAVGSAVWATGGITPDLMLSACLLAYAALATDAQFIRRRWGALWCGLFGGVAFLAKAYALPFVLVHLALAVALHYGRDKAVLRAWGLGLAGVMLAAGPWIGVLSAKYHKPTVSTVASIAHAIVGPRSKEPRHPTRQMYELEPGRISIWETPERMKYNRWSPFERRRYMLHQLRYTRDTAAQIIKTVARYDLLSLGLPMLAAAILLAMRRRDAAAIKSFIHLVLLGAVYCGGFTLVFFFDRYIESFIWPIALAAGLAAAAYLGTARWAAGRPWAPISLVVVILLSFGYHVGRPLLERRRDSSAYRELARRMEQRGLRGPVASTDWKEGLYIAYHLNAPHAGVPVGWTRGEVDAELDAHGIRTLIASQGWSLLATFADDPHWRKVEEIDGPEGKLTLLQRD